MDQIYNTYLSSKRVSERIDTVGTRVLDEINQVLDMIDAASGTATTYSESLADASEKLQGANDGASMRVIIEHLVEGAKEMEINNKKLEARLSASRREIAELQQNLEAVRNESLTDPLTTLSNRKFFDIELARLMAQAKAKSEPLSLLMTDVDHFKVFNDKYGHLTGDQVLRLVAISVRQGIKAGDVAARYGGEEFTVALPNQTLQQAATIADHIRHAVMTKELMKRSNGQRLGRLTMSIGVALLRADDSPLSFLERADACLYAAKRHGRNRVVCETDPEAAAPGPYSARVA
jgi:diguanylate cyclase